MKKLLSVLLLLFISINSIWAQASKGKDQFNIGITNFRPHMKHDYSDSYLGFTIGYNRFLPIYKNFGAEIGCAFRYVFNEDQPEAAIEHDDWYKFISDSTHTALTTFIIPVSFTYNIPISKKVSFCPLIGLNLRYNSSYKTRVKEKERGLFSTYDWFKYNSEAYDYQHFQLGAQVGARLYINKCNIGFTYEPDITKFEKKDNYKAYTFNLSFGFNCNLF